MGDCLCVKKGLRLPLLLLWDRVCAFASSNRSQENCSKVNIVVVGKRHKDKKEEVTEPEADPERDQRTVFAYQICLKADERDAYEFFSRAD
ncbi:Ribosomal protein L18ae/LX family protein [Prunus dulcis]|uniref:Ribosomal protein L18ae/LX family protein n=1 Tax=Prunus dulcis TaxID=3755 RepID=A0A4Y1RFB7_PRUDU|nr:Ribosomal protein L18ae/LX family protein [Prunus dulcis]